MSMRFEDAEIGQRCVLFPGQPDRVFTKVKPQKWLRLPDGAYCGTCGEKPIMLNAFEYHGRGRQYHHICPNTTVTQLLPPEEDKNVQD